MVLIADSCWNICIAEPRINARRTCGVLQTLRNTFSLPAITRHAHAELTHLREMTFLDVVVGGDLGHLVVDPVLIVSVHLANDVSGIFPSFHSDECSRCLGQEDETDQLKDVVYP